MKGAASGVVGDLARARIALDERGQKLGELEERTAAMMASADSFSKHAHDVTKHVYISNVWCSGILNTECSASCLTFTIYPLEGSICLWKVHSTVNRELTSMSDIGSLTSRDRHRF